MLSREGFKSVFFAFVLATDGLRAAPGDTTKVRIFDGVEVFSSSARKTKHKAWVTLPDESIPIHKIFAILRWECTENERCDEWDYLNHVRLTERGTESKLTTTFSPPIELIRMITPYGSFFRTMMVGFSTGRWI